jgi:hypothetical protein
VNPNQNTSNPEVPTIEPPIIPSQQNEIPVQNNQQPTPVEQLAQQPIETVVQPPVQNVVPDMQTPQPIQTQQEVVQPAVPVGPTTETVPGTQQPQAVISSPLITAPVPVKKSKLKLLITIAVAVVVLAGTAVSAWFLMPNLVYRGLPLKEYRTDKYSLLVPEAYMDNSGDRDYYRTASMSVFSDPRSAGNYDYRSSVSVLYNNDSKYTIGYAEAIKKAFDDPDAEKYMLGNMFLSSDTSKIYDTDVSVKKYSRDSTTFYEMSGYVTRKETADKTYISNVVAVKGDIYFTLYISGDDSEPKMEASARRIIDSLKIK